MFTGIILGLGQIIKIRQHGPDAHFDIQAKFKISDLTDGESIAVNGACLSVESHHKENFTVYASKETLAKTTLSLYKVGQLVNLERALAIGERLGGHIVTGHVDGLAQIVDIQQIGHSKVVRLTYPTHLQGQIMSKGSVTLDGISLTINDQTKNFFSVNIIPDTQARTICSSWQVGTQLNLETDVLGKYVEHLLTVTKADNQDLRCQPHSSLTQEFLRQNGFLSKP